MNKDLFSLNGKTALLTGASGFFGVYFAEALLGAGASEVHLTDINEEVVKLAENLSIKYPGQSVLGYKIDQYDVKGTEAFFKELVVKNKIDILINNSFDFGKATGFNDQSGRIENTTFEHFEKCLTSGLWWPFQATQIIGLDMKKRGGGSIVNIGSMYALVSPNPNLYSGTDFFNPWGYGSSKAAVLQLTRYSASFLSPEVRVNAICPGAIPNTEKKSPNAVDNEKNKEFMSRLVDRTLLKRVGHPSDLVGALVFLCGDASSYITGQSIVIDGGWVIT